MLRLMPLLVLVFATSAVVHTADALVWRKGQTRIMPLGDSITNAGPGWRTILQDLLRSDGWTFRMVGGRNEPLLPEGYSTYASGFGGWQIGGLPASQEFGGGNADWAAQRPDLILFHMGTNDLQWGQLSGVDTRLSTKLDEIWTALPDVTILVAKIIPGSDSHSVNSQGVISYNSQVDAFNLLVPTVVAAKRSAGRKCVLVDQWTGFDKSTMLGDSVHPNTLGHQHMAQVWLTAMQVSLAGERPANNLPPLVSARSGGATQVGIAPNAALSVQGTLVDDDGRGAVSYTWSKAYGPGAVTIANASALSTSATFTVPGAYALRLRASDGSADSCDFIRVLVSGAAVPGGGTPGHVISLAFNDASTLVVGDSAGLVPKAKWTVVSKQQLDHSMPFRIANLADDSGATTTMQYRLAGNNVGSVTMSGAPNSTDGRLMNGAYGSTNPLSHFFTGIPYARYDLYLYFRRNETNATDNAFVHFFSLREHDSDRWIAQIFALNQPAFTGTWTLTPSSSWSDQQASTPTGNVALIPDLDLRDLHLLTGGPGSSWAQTGFARSGLCGVQFVERSGGPAPKLGDINHDGVIDGLDLALVKGQLGRTSSDSGWNSACDLDGNGRVDAADLAQVTRNQGR